MGKMEGGVDGETKRGNGKCIFAQLHNFLHPATSAFCSGQAVLQNLKRLLINPARNEHFYTANQIELSKFLLLNDVPLGGPLLIFISCTKLKGKTGTRVYLLVIIIRSK